jgi:two-component system chemotaxis response regulator CheY
MKSRKVLVVDDIEGMRLIVKDMLEEMGFSSFEEAIDGASALEVLRKEKVGLVVSDFNMTPRSGLELLREIKADPSLREIPFILVTSETEVQIAQDAKKMGVTAFMKKPINFGSFKEHVETIIGPS